MLAKRDPSYFVKMDWSKVGGENVARFRKLNN